MLAWGRGSWVVSQKCTVIQSLNSPVQTKRIKEYLPGYVGVHSNIGTEYEGFLQPDQWEEYMKSKQKDNSDSDDEEEEQQIEASEKRKEMKDKSRRKTKSKIIDLDDDMPLSKLKEALLAEK